MIRVTEVKYLDLMTRCRKLQDEDANIISVCPAPTPGKYAIVYDDMPPLWPEEGGSQEYFNPWAEGVEEEEPPASQSKPAPVVTQYGQDGEKEEIPLEVEPERARELQEENDRKAKALGLKPEVARNAGIRATIDRLKEAALAFFDGDGGKAKAWILSEVPNLDPSKNVLTQLSSEDLLTCLAVLEKPSRMGSKERSLRYDFRTLRDNIRKLKPSARFRPLTGTETASGLKVLVDSLKKNLPAIEKEMMSDEEFIEMFDAVPWEGDDEET